MMLPGENTLIGFSELHSAWEQEQRCNYISKRNIKMDGMVAVL